MKYHINYSVYSKVSVAFLNIKTFKIIAIWYLTNEELEEAINNENIVSYIKYKRLGWLGHVERMTNEREAKTIYK